MPSQVILRTSQEITEHDFQQIQIKDALSILAPLQFEDAKKISDETLSQSYQDRIGMLHEGAMLLVSSLGDAYEFKSEKYKTKDELLQKINEKKRDYQEEIEAFKEQNDIEVLQDLLYAAKEKLERIIRDTFGFNKKRAIHLLNEAISFAEFQRFTKTEGEQKNAGKKTLVTITKDGRDYVQVQIDRPLTPLTEALKEDYRKIKASIGPTSQGKTGLPSWYHNMDADERKLFNHVIEDIDIDRLNAIPNKLTSISGTRNFTQNEFYLLDNNYNLLTSRSCLRSSHLASRRLIKNNGDGDPKRSCDSKVHTRHNLMNIITQALMAKQSSLTNGATFPLLIQTLITPIPITSMWGKPDVALDKEMNGAIHAIRRIGVIDYRLLDQERTITIKREEDDGTCEVIIKNQAKEITNNYQLKLFSTNHPINPGRFIIPTMTNSHSGREGMRLIKFAKGHKESVEPGKQKEIDAIIEAYEALLEKPPDFITQVKNFFSFLIGKPIEERNRELFLSSYEQLLIEALGGVGFGSCVYSKDRKASEILHTDAMESYSALYGALPTYDATDADRENFCSIVKNLYCSRHHHSHAGQNSPGCDGFQHPEQLFSADIQKAIGNEQLRWDNRLAKNTAFRKIKPVKKKASPHSVTPEEPSINSVSADMVPIDNSPEKDAIKSIEQILRCTHFWAEHTTGKSEPTTNTLLKEKFAMGKGKSKFKPKSKRATLRDICDALTKCNENLFRSKKSTTFRRLIKKAALPLESKKAKRLNALKQFATEVQDQEEKLLILEKAESGPLESFLGYPRI